MINFPFIFYKDNLSKFLLTLFLFVSIFACPGYIGNSKTFQQQKFQTELVCSNNNKAAKQTVAYKKSSVPLYKNVLFNRSHQVETNTLLLHNSIAKVKFKHISKQCCITRIAKRFLQIKTIPQSSNEDIPASILS